MNSAHIATAPMPYPSPARAWYAVFVLTFAFAVSFLSTSAVFVMVDPIKADLGLTDSQIGLLQGFGYVLLYMVIGLAIGRWVDRTSRCAIVAGGAVAWSVMTFACGMAQNFWQLFVARSGVGAAEASVAPAAYSILSDYFPPQRLGAALAVYSTGLYWGQGLALLVGGVLYTALAARDVVTFPLLGAVEPWQAVLLLLSPLGLLAAVLVGTMREPARRGVRARERDGVGMPSRSVPLRDVARYVLDRKLVYAAIIGGVSLEVMCSFGVATWTPTFFIRTYGLDAASVGTTLGILLVVVGGLGALTAARVCTWLEDRGRPDATLLTVIIGSACALPAATLFPLMPTAEGAFVAVAANYFFSGFPFGAATAALNLITPNQMRGQIGAVYQLAINLIGVGVGPVAIGLLTDYALHDESLLRYSMVTITVAIMPLSIVALWLSRRSFVRARDSLAEWERQ